jgi:uncharacterized protein YndB with AHSA1/START domain
MTFEFVTRVAIKASADRVWAILADPSGYASWNPEIVALEGRMETGASIRARVRVGSGAVRSVQLRITRFEAPARMEWTGGLPLGLFTGRRLLTVTHRGEGAEFEMKVTMSGPLAKVMVRAVGDRQAEIDAFSAALRSRAEPEAPCRGNYGA